MRLRPIRLFLARAGLVGAGLVGAGLVPLAACDKPIDTPEPAEAPDPAATETASPAPGPTSAIPPAHAQAKAAPTPVPVASAPHPLDAWMRATASPALLSGDLLAIAAARSGAPDLCKLGVDREGRGRRSQERSHGGGKGGLPWLP